MNKKGEFEINMTKKTFYIKFVKTGTPDSLSGQI